MIKIHSSKQLQATPSKTAGFLAHNLCTQIDSSRKENYMAMKVADLLVEVLAEAGVQRIYGVSGDSLNGITHSMRAGKSLEWIHVSHEETAAFAAGAEGHLTRKLAVCADRCGPGDITLINGL